MMTGTPSSLPRRGSCACVCAFLIDKRPRHPRHPHFPPSIPRRLLFLLTGLSPALRLRQSPLHTVFTPYSQNSSIFKISSFAGDGDDDNNNNPLDPRRWNNGEGGDDSDSDADCCTNPILFSPLLLLWSWKILSRVAVAGEFCPENGTVTIWDTKGSEWDAFARDFLWIPYPLLKLWLKGRKAFMRFMLPEGYPGSVTSDYLEFSLWRGVQGIVAQINEVLATQALLFAVGLGKGAIPTAAAINWVLKDGIGHISKIMLSKYGCHFDVNPKGWRLFGDLLENAAFGMEMCTPAFPQLFLYIGAIAGASRSAATLIQAATRSYFYAGFATQRNFAEVIAKGEAQGMMSKFLGIALGISLTNCIGSSIPLAIASFCAVTWIHMFCNLKSYRAIQLRTLNPYRASLVFSEYLLSGQAPPVREVNEEEPFFPSIQFPVEKMQSVSQLSSQSRIAAAEIVMRLQLGSKLSDVANNKDDVVALFNLYKDEGYILTEHNGKFCVVLKQICTAEDMMKSVFHACYLYWLEKNAGIKGTELPCEDCRTGGKLQVSLDYVGREFKYVKNDSVTEGWMADGLVASPLPHRIHLPKAFSSFFET